MTTRNDSSPQAADDGGTDSDHSPCAASSEHPPLVAESGVDSSGSTDSASLEENGSPHRAGSFRELLLVSLPLIISAGSHSLMGIADCMMLAGYAPPADALAVTTLDIIAAVTPAGMMYWSIACIPMGTILYANTFISQFDGARQPRKLATAFWQGVWLAIVSGVLLMGFVPLSATLFLQAGHTEAVVSQETAYFNTMCLGSVFHLCANALSCYFSGRQKTAVVMYVTLTSVAINVVCDYGLIFGHWGLPELGITGAAAATVFARFCELLMYGGLIYADGRVRYPLASTWRPHGGMLKKFLRYGLPSGLHHFLDTSSFLFFLLIVGSLNRDAMAATNLAFRVNSIIFIPLLGFGTAVQTLVGHHIGAGLQAAASRTTWNAILMGVIWTGGAAILLVFFPDASLQPFLAFEDASASLESGQSIRSVLPMASRLLMFVAVYSIFDAMAVVFASALRGAGDTLFPMAITLFSAWVVMTIPAWLISQMESATVGRLWLTCTGHITLMGTAMALRFLSGKWKRIKLTEIS